MAKLKIGGNGESAGKYLGFNIPPNTLMASFEDKFEIWSAPATQKGIGYGRGEERDSQVIHRMAVTMPLDDFLAENFKKHMKKLGKGKYTPNDLVTFMITFLEFATTSIRGLVPEHARDTFSLRLEEMKKGPVKIHFS